MASEFQSDLHFKKLTCFLLFCYHAGCTIYLLQAVKERQILRRSYYLFLCTIVNNGVVEVIVNCGKFIRFC